MKEVVYSLIVTLAVATGAIVMKQKIRYGFYIFLFIVTLLVRFIFSSAEASVPDRDYFFKWDLSSPVPNAKLEIDILSELLSPFAYLTPQQRTFYEKKLKQHQYDAERTWNNAKNKCWYLPNITKRKAAQNAFQATIAAMGGGTPMSMLVLALMSTLTSYGLDCIDEWYYIEEQLSWCQYHCEMVEFYLTVLEKG